MNLKNLRVMVLSGALLAGALPAGAQPAAPVTFQDIAVDGGAGLAYNRTPSKRLEILERLIGDGLLDIDTEYQQMPYKTYGAPGVAVLDFDNDGDQDIYVTNGPGTPNSLFENLFVPSGQLRFRDVGLSSGAALTRQDSQGICYGDIENDGDLDIFVTGFKDNRLLENRGNGKFRDVTTAARVRGEGKASVSCAMGDVNGDARLDILIANTFDYSSNEAYGVEYALNQHNQLLINRGDGTFADASESSGIRVIAGVGQPGGALVTWQASLIDMDFDGDLDAVIANDQHANATEVGYLRLFRNDGTGHFVDATFDVNLDQVGEWRSVSFGDINCDGRHDLFGTNIGDYILNPGIFPAGFWSSRWLLSRPNGTYINPGVGDLVSLPTGWGSSMVDYDNDADTDIIFYGGWEFSLIWDLTNPGTILQNQGCTAEFIWDKAALAGSTNHGDRNVEGLATGDFNNDGFVDIVSVSSYNPDPSAERIPAFSSPLGSPFDETATFYFLAKPGESLIWEWNDYQRNPGTLSVEINSGNGNNWASFDLVGSAGLVDNRFAEGKASRDGIGAAVRFTPYGGKPTLIPVLGGSGYASQNSLRITAGLGEAVGGTVDVFWPGGARNRVYNVRAGERLVLPEIPCSFNTTGSRRDYARCVSESLKDLRREGVLNQQESNRLEASALRAYDQAH